MNTKHIEYFIKLSELEHYTKAANELGVTQPTLSHAIKSMEKEVGTKLFKKNGRNVELTKYGRIFLSYAKDTIDSLNTGSRKIKELTGQTKGLIDLAYIYSQGQDFAPRLVRDFLNINEHLDIDFNFYIGRTEELINGLKDGKFDLAICSFYGEEEDIRYVPVTVEDLVLVVPTNHPLSQKDSVFISDVSEHEQIFYTKGSGLRVEIEKLFEKEGLHPKISYEIEDDLAMAGLIANGFGIGIMPNMPFLQNMNVSILKLKENQNLRRIYLAYVEENYRSPVVERFIEYIRARII